MRILSVSDLHYRLPHYDWLVKAAADADVVVLAGDLADVVSPVPHEVQAVVLTTYLSRLAEHALVLASSGNHDLDGPGANGEQVAGCGGGPAGRDDRGSAGCRGTAVRAVGVHRDGCRRRERP